MRPRSSFRILASAVAALCLCAASTATAQPDQARGLVEPRGIEPEDVALALPRGLMALPDTFFGLLFTPLRAGLRYLDLHSVIQRAERLIVLDVSSRKSDGDDQDAAVLPLITLDTFLGVQLGLQAFHENLGGHGERARIRLAWGPHREQQYRVELDAAHVGGLPLWIDSATALEDHPSLRFWGVGRQSAGPLLAADRPAYYSELRFRQRLTVGATFGSKDLEARVGARGRFKAYRFGEPRGVDPRSQPTVGDVGAARRAVGFDSDPVVTEAEGVARMAVHGANGASAHAFEGEAYAGAELHDYRYAQFGGEIRGTIDVLAGNRLLVLRLAYQGVEASADSIPFVELPSLGGPERLRGYPLNRFIDRNAILVSAEYRYPVHEFLRASLFCDLGQVARRFETMFVEPSLHPGGGAALTLHSRDRVYASVEVAGGEGVQVLFTTDALRAWTDRDESP